MESTTTATDPRDGWSEHQCRTVTFQLNGETISITPYHWAGRWSATLIQTGADGREVAWMHPDWAFLKPMQAVDAGIAYVVRALTGNMD